MTTALTLPKLAGGRHLVLQLLYHVPVDLKSCEVVVHAEGLVSAAPSFADELCKEILVTRCAARLRVDNASENLARYLLRSANARGVSEKLIVNERTQLTDTPV